MKLFKFKFVCTALFVFSITLMTAQVTESFALAETTNIKSKTEKKAKKVKKAPLFQPASFVGGKSAFVDFLNENIKYPDLAQEYNIEGTMIVRFKVMEDGSIQQFKIKQSLHPACDQKVIEELQKMPNWKPAKQGRAKIAMWFEVPMKFTLQ
ncbi:MAG: energy transducer TonB [Bacteroidota bacterium]